MRAHAQGLYHSEAAVELLIGHRKWLCRNDFVTGFVRLVPCMTGEGSLAMVSWRAAVKALAAGLLPCSGSEGHVLRIAASIADSAAVDLRACLSNLDGRNVVLVAGAVLAAAGHHEAGAALAGVRP